jgi:hypothetical protein
LSGACRREGDENLGIGGRRDAIDLQHLTRPAELVRALGQPGRLTDAKLGPHRLMASSSIRVTAPSGTTEQLDETYRLDADGAGAFHLWHDNSRDGGAEGVVSDGELYVRPRYGHFVKRRPEGDEVDRLRVLVEAVPAGYLELLEPWLVVRETGPSLVGGRPAVKLQLRAAGSRRWREESEPGRKWRQTVQVDSLDGDLAVDAQTGTALEGRIDATYRFEREGERSPFKVTLQYKQWSDVPEAILAPAESMDAPRRARPMVDRNSLLDGLVTR